jgi:hypothetical protein
MINMPEFSVKFTEELGLGIPMVTIEYKIEFLYDVINTLYLDKPFVINFNNINFNYKIVHYHMPDELNVSIIGFLDNLDFIQVAKQSYYEGNSIDAIRQIASLPVITSVKTDDKQIWIQDNVPDKRFCVDTLLHSNLPNDHLIYYINKSGKLIINSYNDTIKAPTITLGSGSSDLGPRQIMLECIPTSFRYLVQNNQYIANQNADLDSYTSNLTSDLSKTYSVGIDCGNVNQNYYSAYNYNNNRYLDMMTHLYAVRTNSNKFVNPMDVIRVLAYPDHHGLSDMPSIVNQNFLVVKVDTRLDTNSILSQTIYFCRIGS